MLFVNLKTYLQSTGDNAVKLALSCELAHDETHLPIIPVVSPVDLWRVTQHTDIPVWIQHVDYHAPGTTTGFTTIEAALAAGAHGTILNHSEHTLSDSVLAQTVQRIRSIDPDFTIMICTPTPDTLSYAATLAPDYIAYEPPELIASTSSSVATEHADTIQKAVEKAGNIPLIVGAGIKDTNDITVSLQKGAQGILIASAVVKAEDPKEKLTTLARSFNTS